MQLERLKTCVHRKTSEWTRPDETEVFFFSRKGYCPCCDQEVNFEANNSWLRDKFLCEKCHSIPRQRALMWVIEQYIPGWRNAKIHESSPTPGGASQKLKTQCQNYITTQYFPHHPMGEMVNDFRNENLEKQTFEDNVFDLVITQDVMEHVYHPDEAFREIARTLRPGGAHIFTVPLVNKHKPSEQWAIKGEDGPIFLKTPEWHGNPIDENGSPVTMHWGFDIVSYIQESSGLKTTIEHIDDLRYGIRAELIEVLVSVKNSL